MQNKFVILALLGLANASQSVQVNTKDLKQPAQKPQQPHQDLNQKDAKPQKMAQAKAKAPEGAAEKEVFGAINSKTAIHDEIRKTARKMEIEPPSMEEIKKNMYVPEAAELEKESEGVAKMMKEVRVIGGDSGKKNKAAVMTESDQACYSSRYSDLKGKNAKEHFRVTGDLQGRLDTCARDLSDYEAKTYLLTFPELQAKFGDGASAIKQARKHWKETGYAQAHFSEPMKDTSKNAWKCGEGAKQSCKCHGTLWYGATVAPDDKKPIDTWEKMREWKTMTKESDEWMSCTDANFGGDPWPNQEKQCWCEDKPAYKPHKCGEEGQECLCDGGWVIYGQKLDNDKKELDFFGTIKLSLAVTGTKGKKSVNCDAATFDGADPAPDQDKQCFCDSEQKFFDSSFVKATKTFWRAAQLEAQSDGELKRTAEHSSEVRRVGKEQNEKDLESSTSTGVENEKAKEDIAAAKTCAIQAIEESYRFRKAKIETKKVAVEKAIGKRRAQVTTWQFQLNQKKTAAEETCKRLNQKASQDKTRLEEECKRMTTESEELSTQIQVEIEKINQEEKTQLAEIRLEESKLESKRTKETIQVEQKADEDVNEINEQQTEKQLDAAEEKESLVQQQQELIKIQQKTSKKIEASIKDQQGAINILINNLRKKLTDMARKEQVLVAELSDDAPERETVVNRIITRSKETITKLTKTQTELKSKKTKTQTAQASLKVEIKTLTDRLTEIQAKIVTGQENLKLKIAERTSKKEILQTYGEKAGTKSANGAANGKSSAIEGAIVTQGQVDKLSAEIKQLRESIKVNIQQKNEVFTLKVTTQKQIDLHVNQVKTIDTQLKNIKDFITEIEGTIETVESKIKEEIATKKVITTQKEAFKAAQKKTEAEEALNSTRIVAEKEKVERTAESKECKKEYDQESARVKQLQDQLKTLQKTASDSKGSKEEKARLDSEVASVQDQVNVAMKQFDKQTQACAEIDGALTMVVTQTKEKMARLSKAIEQAKITSEQAEKEAKATIVTLPGGDKDIAKEEAKEKSTEAPAITSTSITISSTSATKGKTTTGKPKPPPIPAPKPKEEEPEKDDEGKPKKKPVPVPVSPPNTTKTTISGVTGEVVTSGEEDDGEPSVENPTEVPGGEAQITKEVTENTLAAHNARVELTKTKENMSYELKTIKEKITKFNAAIKEVKENIAQDQSLIKSETAKLESMKATSVTAKLQDVNKGKIDVEISAQVGKITEIEARITKNEATEIEYKGKVAQLTERRKEIKYKLEVKVLEAKEAESAVLESIKTVTDVELLNRKRWIASKSVGNYQKCKKFMAEYKMIFEKQNQVLKAEQADHQRRIDIADGAMTALKEKKTLLKDAKKSKELEANLAKIDEDMQRHAKVAQTEGKIAGEVANKIDKNLQEYVQHQEQCAKARVRANIASSAVNDAATTLKNQREYQVQVTNLKNLLVGSHEAALEKRAETNKVFQNYTMMVTKFEQELTVANEQIMDAKTKISGAQEIQRILAVRMKEIATLTARPTITAAEKTKLTTEEGEIKNKVEAQQNTIDIETKNLVQYETNVATLQTTIKTFKGYVKEIQGVIKQLEKKVKETQSALKSEKKKDTTAPPVKGKTTDATDAEAVDEEGDAKVDEVDTNEEVIDEVKGGNEKVDKELDQVEEENASTSTQIDSLTKTITTVAEKSEIADKEVIQETADTATEEAQLADLKVQKERLTRVRERQRCARLFPVPFSAFKIGHELKQENMCPCPGGGKGLTMLILENIKDQGEFDKFVLHLFEQNLAVEGNFAQQMQRLSLGADGDVVGNESEVFTLRLVVNDDKIDNVMTALDQQALSYKSTDFKISPLLKGKNEYQKWQQTNLASKSSTGRVHLGGELDEELDEELEE